MKTTFLRVALAATLMLPAASSPALAGDPAMTMIMTKTPGCGCCSAWAEIARREGYDVEILEDRDYAGTKRAHGVPARLRSCHSTRIGGYVVEGHVPLAAVKKLLTEKPRIDGIAVPGMPAGSPGMGDDPGAVFDVVSFGGTAGDGALYFRAGQ